MRLSKTSIAIAAAGAIVGAAWAETARADYDSYTVPNLVYRTGAYAPNGIPLANGFIDYFNMLNARDGGVDAGSRRRCTPPRRRASPLWAGASRR